MEVSLKIPKQALSDGWVNFKILCRIPLPLKNNFYKGRVITLRRYWFCKSCHKSFDLKPWGSYKYRNLSEIECPYCHSGSFHWSSDLFKAMVDGKSPKELLGVIENTLNEG